jgi:Flp pilus assembly protein TadB
MDRSAHRTGGRAMSGICATAALVAMALLIVPDPENGPGRLTRLRLIRPGPAYARAKYPWSPARAPASWLAASAAAVVAAVGGWPGGVLLAGPIAAGTWWAVTRMVRRSRAGPGPAGLAVTWDLLAACLRSGLPVPTAIRAVARDAPDPAARAALCSTAELLALGAGAAEAWAPAEACPATAELARAARRTARSGTALAEVGAELAERARAGLLDEAEAKAQRAAVLITGPLGLCYLPAFLCLGVVPVVLGLAGQLALPG